MSAEGTQAQQGFGPVIPSPSATDDDAQAQRGFGPAIPSPSASVVLRPLGRDSVTITSGLLHQWQERNRSASLPLALRQLDTAGNLANLRLAIDHGEGEYRGPQFMDSDLYKTLEGIAWEVSRAPSEPLASFAAQATELLEAAQQPDGYLNSYVQVTGRPRYANLAYSHELYCAGNLIQAGVAAQRSRGTGGSALFTVARRFADHLVKEFLGTHDGLDGHPIVETALVELYRETGDAEYLRLASQFVEQRGHGLIGDSGFGSRYLQDHLPVREANTLSGHAVRALYLEAGVVDLATETGDVELLVGSAVRWDDMVSAKTCLTGSVGSRHAGESFGDRFELPPDRAYNETCAEGTPARRRHNGLGWYIAGGVAISAIFVVPLLWEVFRSFQPESTVTNAPSSASFTHLTWANYTTLLSGQDDILRNVINSLIVGVLTAVITAVVATLAGYGFTMFPFRGSGLAFGVVLVAFMIPFQAVLTPLFLELHFLHLLNSLIGLALFNTTFILPLGAFVMRNSFLQVPQELADAARVDGASVTKSLISVFRPLVMPGIATTALYAFLFSWTEFLGALSFLTNDSLFTLPVALSNAETGTYGAVNYGLLLAGAVIAMIPCVVVYVSLQRFYVRGLVSGALKG